MQAYSNFIPAKLLLHMSSTFLFVLGPCAYNMQRLRLPKHLVEMSPTIIHFQKQPFLSSILYMSPFNFIECACILQLSEEINAGLWRSVDLCVHLLFTKKNTLFSYLYVFSFSTAKKDNWWGKKNKLLRLVLITLEKGIS